MFSFLVGIILIFILGFFLWVFLINKNIHKKLGKKIEGFNNKLKDDKGEN